MPLTLADRADLHRLYELAVQAPAHEAGLLAGWFQERRGRPARTLREDFCGTAALGRAWVRQGPGYRAIGIDCDPAVLARGRAEAHATHSAAGLDLLVVDLYTHAPAVPAVDLAVALNFSYWLIRERAALLGYFQRLRQGLVADGMLFLDAFGGADAWRVLTERRAIDDGGAGFTYVWEQASVEPVSGVQRCHIHFEFPDGSRRERAFSYTWRLWALPELRELLTEAGFSRVTVYWQGWDANGRPDGRFLPATAGTADAGWICYLGAEV